MSFFDKFKKPDTVYSQPPVLIGSSTKRRGFEWYRALINYERVQELTKNHKGKVAVLDDTATTTNNYLQGKIDMIYEFTNEGGVSGFHGHHVSGIITSNKHGLFKNTSLGMFKVLSSRNGLGVGRWITSGIEAAQIEGYEVINASLGSDKNDAKIESAVKIFCANPKRFFVCASGNDASATDYPAALSAKIDGVISVGAVEYHNNQWEIATFSSFGAVTVAAAGVDILSTFPDNKEEYLSGTSMATPFISGLIAASKAIYPEFNHNTFKEILSKCVTHLAIADTHQGKGVVKIVEFLEAVTALKNGEAIPEIITNNPPIKKERCSILKKIFK